jgi:signal transduction histidine kinase
LPRPTVRLRLTLVYGGLFLVSGAGVLAITYALVDHFTEKAKIERFTTGGVPYIPPDISELEAQFARQHAADMHQLLLWSAVALAIMAVASIALGWLVAGRALRPLRTITAAARDISATDLHRRLSLTGPDDELKHLADTFDGLLARLERSFSSQRQFVANASHELRTPLTLEHLLLEGMLTDPDPTVESWRPTCERLLAATEQQERLIEAFLTLARSEGGLDRWEHFNLDVVTDQVVLARRADAEHRGLRLAAVLKQAPAFGDPRLVERLVVNLVDNALRHNVSSGRVDVVVGTKNGHSVLSVTNTGPVVPAAEVGRMFQPFQRLGANRTGTGEGIGLGLSIVAAIAAAHGAMLAARPRHGGGLEVEVSFRSATVAPHGGLRTSHVRDRAAGQTPAAQPGSNTTA